MTVFQARLWRARRWIAGCAAAVVSAATFTVAGAAPASAQETGGVNTGLPGSTCQAETGGLSYSAPGPGISTTALGPAPAYYELGAPAGAFLGQAPKGLMIVIHGGGWAAVGPGAVASTRPYADTWRNRGWETLNTTYRACAQSLDDVLWSYDHARALVGPELPICAYGMSAGAHLALELASLRSGVGCVIGEGAPTDLPALFGETAYDPATGLSDQQSGPQWVQNLAAAAFGQDQIATVSPSSSPGTARLLLATAQQDEFIPWAQSQDMSTAVEHAHPGTYVDTDQLAAGNYFQFTHTTLAQGTGVSKAAYDDYLRRQLQLVAPLVAPPGTTRSVINDIRVPAMGNYAIGDEELDTTTTAGQTRATAGGRVDLGAGATFRLQTCVAYYDPILPSLWSCNQSTIDTHANAAPAGYPLPSADAQWTDPAARSGQGFAFSFSTVSYLDNGSWTQVASSVPDSIVQAGFYVSAS